MERMVLNGRMYANVGAVSIMEQSNNSSSQVCLIFWVAINVGLKGFCGFPLMKGISLTQVVINSPGTVPH
jgi:hypothetical protein